MDNFDKLSNDEVVDICYRLEVKDMMRLKCVSKSWYRIISDLCIPTISKRLSLCGIHFRTAAMSMKVYDEKADKYVLMNPCRLDHVRERFYHELETCFDRQVMQYVSSSSTEEEEEAIENGLLEVHGVSNKAQEFVDSRYGLLLFSKESSAALEEYHVCNPTTNQCVSIPQKKADSHVEERKQPLLVHAALAFDPTVSPHYKVVCLSVVVEGDTGLQQPAVGRLLIDIFSSESGMWQQHQVELLDIPVEYFVFKRNSVFLDGVLYMMSLSWKIISLDINSLDLGVIQLPIPDSIWGRVGFKGCLGMREEHQRGCLGLAAGGVYYSWLEGHLIRLWLLVQDTQGGGFSWTLKHTADCCELRSRIFVMDGRKSPMWVLPCGVHPNSEAIFLGTVRHIFLYNFITDELQLLHRASEGQVLPLCFYSVFTYSRCLVPLNHFSTRQWMVPPTAAQITVIENGVR